MERGRRTSSASGGSKATASAIVMSLVLVVGGGAWMVLKPLAAPRQPSPALAQSPTLPPPAIEHPTALASPPSEAWFATQQSPEEVGASETADEVDEQVVIEAPVAIEIQPALVSLPLIGAVLGDRTLEADGTTLRVDAAVGAVFSVRAARFEADVPILSLALAVSFEPANPCYPDCDQSTGTDVLDIFDFMCFSERFATGDPYACDCDLSTGPRVCDVFDILCFTEAFNAGCP